MDRRSITIGLTAGPTGGHLVPAALVGRKLREIGCETVLLSTASSDHFLLEDYQGRFERLDVAPWAGRGPAGRLVSGGSVLRELIRLRNRVGTWDALVSFGGYSVVPVLLAAWEQGVQSFLQEQNRQVGRAHRLFYAYARKIFYGFPPLEEDRDPHHPVLGNPVREVVVPEDRWFHDGPLLLVIGGSQGSRPLSRVLASSVPALLEAGWRVYYVRGQFGLELSSRFADRKEFREVGVEPEVPGVMDAANGVWSRAGAGTLSEVLRTGTPALLFPFPDAADDHQRINARWVAKRGPARVVSTSHTSEQLVRLSETLEAATGGYRVPWSWDPSPQQQIAEAVLDCLGL